MEPRQVSRYEFMQNLGRGGMLAGMLGVALAALHGTKEVSECIGENHCASCWAYGGCSLPEKKETTDE
ncbi:MAG: hypothetical protein WC655_00165 [Candidatus Hydrogenedentales bacterium]